MQGKVKHKWNEKLRITSKLCHLHSVRCIWTETSPHSAVPFPIPHTSKTEEQCFLACKASCRLVWLIVRWCESSGHYWGTVHQYLQEYSGIKLLGVAKQRLNPNFQTVLEVTRHMGLPQKMYFWKPHLWYYNSQISKNISMPKIVNFSKFNCENCINGQDICLKISLHISSFL